MRILHTFEHAGNACCIASGDSPAPGAVFRDAEGTNWSVVTYPWCNRGRDGEYAVIVRVASGRPVPVPALGDTRVVFSPRQ